MLPLSRSGVTVAADPTLTIFTFRPACRKNPSCCATYSPAAEAVGTVAMTRLGFSAKGDPAAAWDPHPALASAARTVIDTATCRYLGRFVNIRDNLDMGETIGCRHTCRKAPARTSAGRIRSVTCCSNGHAKKTRSNVRQRRINVTDVIGDASAWGRPGGSGL